MSFSQFFTSFVLGCFVCAMFIDRKQEPPVNPEKAVTVTRTIPPPPRITVPPFPAADPSVWEKTVEFFTGPCTPILPAFKTAHDVEFVRPKLAKLLKGDEFGRFNLGQVCIIFEEISLKWHGLDDPAQKEMVSKASDLMDMPAGDCDDYCVAVSAAITSIGGITRNTFAYNKQGEGHAYAEVCLGKMRRSVAEGYIKARYDLDEDVELFMREDVNGLLWLNLDWTADHPGGRYFDAEGGVIYWPVNDQCVAF